MVPHSGPFVPSWSQCQRWYSQRPILFTIYHCWWCHSVFGESWPRGLDGKIRCASCLPERPYSSWRSFSPRDEMAGQVLCRFGLAIWIALGPFHLQFCGRGCWMDSKAQLRCWPTVSLFRGLSHSGSSELPPLSVPCWHRVFCFSPPVSSPASSEMRGSYYCYDFSRYPIGFGSANG